jgi:choline dehydrogenase-like flavoprotein
MGISIVPLSSGNGQRYSSEKAFLESRPHNLTIWTYSRVSRVLFEEKTAVGIETVDGKKGRPVYPCSLIRVHVNLQIAYASKEIIITSGSIDSPKLLLLSGVGPAKELETHGIQSIHNLPAVGKNAVDHVSVFVSRLMDRSFSGKFEFALDSAQQTAALEEWRANHGGPLSFHGSSNTILFQKDETIYDTNTFKSLDEEKRNFLRRPDVPTFEIITVRIAVLAQIFCIQLTPYQSGPLMPPTYPMTPDHSYASHVIVVLNPQSMGSVTLQSKNPRDRPVIDPGYFTHPYDMHSMIAGLRAEQKLMKTKIMSEHHIGSINVPKSYSDEDVMVRTNDSA